MTLSPQDFSLQFHPALSTDTAEYICLVNDRHSPEAIIDLLVQGKHFKAQLFYDYAFRSNHFEQSVSESQKTMPAIISIWEEKVPQE